VHRHAPVEYAAYRTVARSIACSGQACDFSYSQSLALSLIQYFSANKDHSITCLIIETMHVGIRSAYLEGGHIGPILWN
jgi:hypothetical protein